MDARRTFCAVAIHDLTGVKNSCGLSVVLLHQSSEPFVAANLATARTHLLSSRREQ
jgi:hypothetical protein